MDLNAYTHVLPPRDGKIAVAEVTAGAASAVIQIEGLASAQYVSIVIDDGAGNTSGAYLISAESVDPADPVPTAKAAEVGRCFFFPADTITQLVFTPRNRIKVLVPGTGTYYVRQYPSGPQG